MAKKKKSVSSPSTRAKDAKEAKEVKELKEVKDVKEIMDVPVQSPPSATMAPSPPVGGVEITTARDRLTTALRMLVDKTDGSSDASGTAESSSEAKAIVKKEKTTVAATAAARLAKRTKRQRTTSTDSAFHHTYVMKLFDRSVDLAQFKEGTPLYPICRAWMANQPRNTNLGAQDPPSPEALEEEDRVLQESDEKSASELPLAEGAAPPMKKTYKLPDPLLLSSDPVERRNLKIPELPPREKVLDVDMEMEVKPTRDTLLHDHLTHWIQVRKNWVNTGHRNETRFTETSKLLREIFKRS